MTLSDHIRSIARLLLANPAAAEYEVVVEATRDNFCDPLMTAYPSYRMVEIVPGPRFQSPVCKQCRDGIKHEHSNGRGLSDSSKGTISGV